MYHAQIVAPEAGNARRPSLPQDTAPPSLAEQIRAARDEQEVMTAANRELRAVHRIGIRWNGPAEDIEIVQFLVTKACGREFSVTAIRALLKPDASGRIGFPPCQLRKNSAEIRRLEKRPRGGTHPGHSQLEARRCRLLREPTACVALRAIDEVGYIVSFVECPALKAWCRRARRAGLLAYGWVYHYPQPKRAWVAAQPLATARAAA